MENKIRLVKLVPDHEIKPFDCGDSDLNDFLLTEAKKYASQLLAATYILEDNEETIACYSLINDKISVFDSKNKSQWKKTINKSLPFGMRFSSYPATKIGRLAVSTKFKGQGWGTIILDYLKQFFLSEAKTGCRFLTVDAYNESIPFYAKNEFTLLIKYKSESDTQLMYYDLIKLI